MKKGKLIVLTGAIIVIFFVMLHSNPTTAITNKSVFYGVSVGCIYI
ncbi:hypothetical protein LG311_03140 [Sutcliffiella horikoshii]